MLGTNLDGFYNVLKPVVMPMVSARKPGRIVALSSVSGVMGNRGQVNYSAAKAGIIGAAKALAVELAKRKITVNCVAPGPIETDMMDGAPLEEILKAIPMQRIGTPEEVAAVVGFLCSDAASYMTRQVIGVNGAGVMRRVVVTGMGGVAALGETWSAIRDCFARWPRPAWCGWRAGSGSMGLNTRAWRRPLVGFSVDDALRSQEAAHHGPGVAHGGVCDRNGAASTPACWKTRR